MQSSKKGQSDGWGLEHVMQEPAEEEAKAGI